MTILIKLIKHLAGLLTGVMPLRGLRQTILEIHKASTSANKLELPYTIPNNSDLSSHRPENTLGASSALFLNSTQCSAVGRGLQCPLYHQHSCVSFVGMSVSFLSRKLCCFTFWVYSLSRTVRRRLRLTRQPRYRVQGLLCPTAVTSYHPKETASTYDRLWCFRPFHPLHLTQWYLNTDAKVSLFRLSDELSCAYSARAVLT